MALKEIENNTKYLKKNKNYNEILEKPSTSTSRPCRRCPTATAPP
jgi:hypothetical protein